ncbi:16406_t:CDS:2, partial [Funneliformis mosseae]
GWERKEFVHSSFKLLVSPEGEELYDDLEWERPSCLLVINIQRTTLGPFVFAMGKAVLVRDCPIMIKDDADKPFLGSPRRQYASEMAEEKSRAEAATVTTDQVQKYARSTTTKISKNSLMPELIR